MNRRKFLQATTAGAAISAVDWLGYFKRYGVPGTSKQLGMAEAMAAVVTNPHYLIYWFIEGGWLSYAMLSPIGVNNDSTGNYGNSLNPNPSWSNQRYMPKNYGNAPYDRPKTSGNITYGHLAQNGVPLFPDMAVVSSHHGSTFHSGSRFDYHYGKYGANIRSQRQPNERSVMQAFCEAYGAPYLVPNLSWHRWISDGELSFNDFPEGTGYFERLGPAYAHTLYAKTPGSLRNYLQAVKDAQGGERDKRIRSFVDNLHNNLVSDNAKTGQSVAAFASAVQSYKNLIAGGSEGFDPAAMFNNAQLIGDFGINQNDLTSTATSINGNAARSKECPSANTQAMMTYEMFTKGLSCSAFIESRDVRSFDIHDSRRSILSRQGLQDQLGKMNRELWEPLKVLTAKLKATPYPDNSGRSYWDVTNVVVCSEMGRSIHGETGSISGDINQIMEQDVCTHWDTSAVAFLGGNVKGGTQFGKVGSETMDSIPLMPDGTLDPAFNPDTGKLQGTASPQSYISDAGHVYATALSLSGINPAGVGRNQRPAMEFIKK